MAPDRPVTRSSDPGEKPLDASGMSLSDDGLLGRAVLKLSGNILGLVLGILFSLIIFVATNWLVIKGGTVVGPHLQLLNQYFIGYSVSFIGSLIAIPYAFVTGYLAGFIIAWIYNGVVALTARKQR